MNARLPPAFEQSRSETRQMATVKGTTQNKRKLEPYESKMRRSRELSNALSNLLERWQRPPSMEEVNELILVNYTEKDLQEAVLVENSFGSLPIHWACMYNAPLEVIQVLLDSDADKKSIFERDNFGSLPIHKACESNAPVEVIQLLLESDVDKKSIFVKTDFGKLPIHYACETNNAPVEVIQLLLEMTMTRKRYLRKTRMDNCPSIKLVRHVHL
jgi:hypothetical protein